MKKTTKTKRAIPPIRVGVGYDVHRFAANRALVLGGVSIPHPFGLEGHSDADVLIHAIGDALLGAAGLRDIGHYFSDRDRKWKGKSSRFFLKTIVKLIGDKGWIVGNVDAVLIAERPKFKSYLGAMKKNLAADLRVSPAAINVKATTEERMGFTGSYEGMAAHAVALLVQGESRA